MNKLMMGLLIAGTVLMSASAHAANGTNVGIGGGYKAAVTDDNGEVIWISNRTYKDSEKADKRAAKKAARLNKKNNGVMINPETGQGDLRNGGGI